MGRRILFYIYEIDIATAFHCIKATILTTDMFFTHWISNVNMSAQIGTQYFDSHFVYIWKVIHIQKTKLPVAITSII